MLDLSEVHSLLEGTCSEHATDLEIGNWGMNGHLRHTRAMTTFSITRVNALRDAVTELCAGPDDAPDGWSKSHSDPMTLLAAFPALRIKPGLVLRAYQFKAGGNGNGVVWAMPADSYFPDPDECSKLKNQFLEPPKPPEALCDLMDAIDGDGAPWSYLSASIFAREAAEFGAKWHGCHWSTHAILGDTPWHREPKSKDRRKRQALASGSPDEWTWNAPRPEIWQPTFAEQGHIITLTFYTFSGLAQEAIYRFTDTYRRGSYKCDTEQATIAEGSHGYIF